MTTRSWSSQMLQNNDTEFRAWVNEFADYCDQIGLPRTADTGQINLLTATRPAAGVAAGYEIREHVVAGLPTIYIKLEYGTHGGQLTESQIWATIGTGTNGAGAITGNATARRSLTIYENAANSAAFSQSYFCRTANGFGLNFHSAAKNGNNSNFAFIAVSRTVDASGNNTATGFVTYLMNNVNQYQPVIVQAFRTAAPAQVFPADGGGHFTTVVHGLITQVNGDNPIFPHQMPTPVAQPVIGVCSYVSAHIAAGLTFSATLVGATPRTYIAIGPRLALSGAPQTSASYSLAMLWE